MQWLKHFGPHYQALLCSHKNQIWKRITPEHTHTDYCPAPFPPAPLIASCPYTARRGDSSSRGRPDWSVQQRQPFASSPPSPVRAAVPLALAESAALGFALHPSPALSRFQTRQPHTLFTCCSLFNLFGHRGVKKHHSTLYIPRFAEFSSPLPPASNVCSFPRIYLRSVLLVHEFDAFLHWYQTWVCGFSKIKFNSIHRQALGKK